MKITESKVNPLPDLFNLIPDAGLPLTGDTASRIGLMLNAGGVKCETIKELVETLILFSDWYGLIEVDTKSHEKYVIIRKLNCGD